MNQNTPNPRLALRLPILARYPLNWVKRLSPNVNLRPRMVLDTQVLLPTRNGDGRSNFLADELCLIPEESAGQSLWERQRNTTDSEHHQVGETRENRHSLHQFSHEFSGIFACVSGESPGYGVGLWLKLIPFIITFDLI